MIEKIKRSKPLTAILLVVLFGLIGGTIAYYTTTDTFTNEFDAGKYVIKTEEVFESPSNWLPGDETEKKVSVTNQGNVPAAVKVCFTPSWKDENGNPLPLFDNNYEFAALIELDSNYDLYWKDDCNNDYESKYCYYYYKVLQPGETTESLLDHVTYNPYFEFEGDTTCTIDPTTHKQTCTTELDGYSGGTYTLKINIETVQFNQYQHVWYNSSVYDITGMFCEKLHISNTNYNNMLIPNTSSSVSIIGNSNYSPLDVKKIKIMDNKNIPNDAIDSWDVSMLQDGSVMAWLMDENNDNFYELYIGANGKVVANNNSNYLFSRYVNVEEIDVTNLDTSNVWNMFRMFENVGRYSQRLNIIGLNTWDVSNVEDMSYMFEYAGDNDTTWSIGNISNWNTKKLIKLERMFYCAGGEGVTIDFSNWDVSNVSSACAAFDGTEFTPIGIDSDKWDYALRCES